MLSIKNKIIWLTIFSIAMGFMETAIVIYLRKMYYPAGFSFPLREISPDIALIEFLREAATIIMLIGIGIIAGKTAPQKFAYFIYCFAIWDIFYYVFLKLLINWPSSFSTWDILFIIPVPWVGPVVAPCIISATMILLSFIIIWFSERGYATKLNYKEWLLFITGSLVVLFSFTEDYLKIISMKNKGIKIWTLAGKQSLFNEMNSYVPGTYNWLLFITGEALLLLGVYILARKISATSRIK